MNRMMKAVLLLMLLFVLPVAAWADAPVMLMDMPESAQMVENVEFDNGDFIQTYQLEDGGVLQLLRYAGFEMTIDELISSDWPLNCGVVVTEKEISGYPVKHAMIWQMIDESGYPVRAEDNGELREGQKMLEIEQILISVDGTTLICQATWIAGERSDAATKIFESLQLSGTQEADVG